MDQPPAYARRILVNLALDGALRRTRRRGELAIDAEPRNDGADRSAEAGLRQVEDAAVLIPALGQLPPRQRAVLVLRYLEDLTEAQTAEMLGCSVGTIKATTSHAFSRLQRSAIRSTSEATLDARAAAGPGFPAEATSPPPAWIGVRAEATSLPTERNNQ
jgi:DNA-directed RNA polymerase specialized sigma24 family protein